MNTNMGLVARKLGNTQFFNDSGNVIRVTALSVGPSVVVGKRTKEKDGYTALQVGFGELRSEKRLPRPQKVWFEKLGIKPSEVVKELRVSEEILAKFEIGQKIKPSDVFTVGQIVDVCGETRGRGFTGVMVRWNFAGFKRSHGAHEYQRHGGSIGTNMTPGRTFLNMKMPGQYGSERVTMLNLKVAKVLDDEQMVLIEGGVPGSKQSIVTVRGAVKKHAKN